MENFKHLPEPFRIRVIEPVNVPLALIVKKQLLNPV